MKRRGILPWSAVAAVLVALASCRAQQPRLDGETISDALASVFDHTLVTRTTFDGAERSLELGRSAG